jgi:hypothetical protein
MRNVIGSIKSLMTTEDSMQCSLVARWAADRPKTNKMTTGEHRLLTETARKLCAEGPVVDVGPVSGPDLGHTGTVLNQRNQRSSGPRTARKRSPHDWRPRNTGPPMVGDTGIEPVTPTVSR